MSHYGKHCCKEYGLWKHREQSLNPLSTTYQLWIPVGLTFLFIKGMECPETHENHMIASGAE